MRGYFLAALLAAGATALIPPTLVPSIAPTQGVVAQVITKHNACADDGNSGDLNSGVCSTATGLNAAQNTGWILIEGYDAADFFVTFTDANDSVTALNVTCETSNSSGTTAASGWDVCFTDVSAGTATYTCPGTYSLTTGTAEVYGFTVTNIRDKYLNCLLTATGTPAAADTALVRVDLRVSP